MNAPRIKIVRKKVAGKPSATAAQTPGTRPARRRVVISPPPERTGGGDSSSSATGSAEMEGMSLATAKQATNKAPDPGQPKSATTSRVIIVVLLLVAAFFYVRAVMQDEPATVATPQVSGGETSQTVDQAAASGPAPSKAPVSAGPDTAAETELADRPKAGQFRDVTADPVQPPTPSVTVPPVSAGPKPLPADQMILLLDIFAPELTGSMMSNQPAGAK